MGVLLMRKHSFCPLTRMCTRCGIPAEVFSALEFVEPCISVSPKVVSLDWWRHLKAHQRLHAQLVSSVAAELAAKS